MPKSKKTARRKKHTLKKFGRLIIKVLTKLFSLGNRAMFLRGCSTRNTLRDFRLALGKNMLTILDDDKGMKDLPSNDNDEVDQVPAVAHVGVLAKNEAESYYLK